MRRNKVCVITATRAEYGLLRWIIDEVQKDADLELQLLVTGSHLMPDFGYTYQEIEQDGYPITAKIEMQLSSSTRVGIVKSMGLCAISLAETFERLHPDILVVLGDRYELLPICNTALVMDIPIAHVSGGDVTEGAIDNQVRNAITMMAKIHFPGTFDSAQKVIQMQGNANYVYPVGETNLDNFRRLPRQSRKELAEALHLDPQKQWILLTYHPETKISLDANLSVIANIIDILSQYPDAEIIITKTNADYGGVQINAYLKEVSITNTRFHLFDNLGQIKYISLLHEARCMIGNSSSGLYEAPLAQLPTLNIGRRQEGRFCASNIITCKGDKASIENGMKTILSEGFKRNLDHIENPFGDGNASVKIKEIIKQFLSDSQNISSPEI